MWPKHGFDDCFGGYAYTLRLGPILGPYYSRIDQAIAQGCLNSNRVKTRDCFLIEHNYVKNFKLCTDALVRCKIKDIKAILFPGGALFRASGQITKTNELQAHRTGKSGFRGNN